MMSTKKINQNNTKDSKKTKWEDEMQRMMSSQCMKRGFYIAVGVLMVLVIGILIWLNFGPSKNEDEGASNQVASEQMMSPQLTSGSVATTIDGRTITYQGAYVVDGIEVTVSAGVYESVKDNEVVFLVINGGALRIDGNVVVNKSGDENFQGRDDQYSFYGLNSAIVVVGENSSVSINGAEINTDVSGANAIVATNGGEVEVSEAKIVTKQDNSRGLHATFGGEINADRVDISTTGNSCAALATDRGEGKVVANNMNLSTAGAGSPLIYSTGSITLSNSVGTATGAQIAVVEGKNSINLQGCELSANGNGNRGSVDNAGVMIYQSMSGDASVGVGSFTATDCQLTVREDSSEYTLTPFFFVTNTNATIDLTGTKITFSPSAKFISALGTNEWGRSGQNGGKVTISVSDVDATNMEVETDAISDVVGL